MRTVLKVNWQEARDDQARATARALRNANVHMSLTQLLIRAKTAICLAMAWLV